MNFEFVLALLHDLLLWITLSFRRLRADPSSPPPSPVRHLSPTSSLNSPSTPPSSSSPAPPTPTSPLSPTSPLASPHLLSFRQRRRRQASVFDLKRPLPLPRRRKTLVLDLDETLIHSTTRGIPDYHVKIEVLIDQKPCFFYVSKRPHADYFLNTVSKWYDLVIFTASMPEYAEPVIDWLDPKKLISKRFFRDSCTHRDGNFLKNLTVIEPDLSQVFIIDNSPSVYSIVPDNAIPIEGWFSDRSDEALLDLLPFLDALRFTEDVRSILSLRTLTGARMLPS